MMESSQSGRSGHQPEDWEGKEQFEKSPMSTTEARSSRDEIISVYEVFVKDDVPGQGGPGNNGKPEVSVISAHTPGNLQGNQQLGQGDCALDLDSIDIISADGDVPDDDDDENTTGAAVNEILEKEPSELESLPSSTNASDENMVVFSHPVERNASAAAAAAAAAAARLIDKDDPRSRLHYVKYLKRDGKTLKIWECGICAKEFRHQYTLMRHLPTHTDERNFKCDACGKAFRQLSTLSQHKAIHSDARPYVCEFCKKTFNRVSTLISHRKTHSEHKPHKCHLCGKGFHQKGNLRNHVFTHTNERPYKCDLCGKGFNQMSNLVCHKVKAHAHAEKMQYSCGICGKEFPRRFSLRSHEELKHGIKYRQPVNSQSTSGESKSSKSRNVRVVNVSEDEQQMFSDPRDKDMNMTEFMENIIIDKIETKAMEAALLQGQTPFALFKPAKGIPVLVKVDDVPNGSFNHLLTPATADDLKMSGKMDSSSPQLSDIDGSKSVQIKVPVVATVTEKIEPDGKISFIIEPPGPDQDQVYRLHSLSHNHRDRLLTTQQDILIHIYAFPPFLLESLLTPVDSISDCMPCDIDGYSHTEQFPNQLQQLQSQPHGFPTSAPPSAASSHSATDDELLELAAMGGIQFVRATEDGSYEVMTNSEARNLMAANSHDVKILGAEETEAINSVISVHGDMNYHPGSAIATAVLTEDGKHQHQQSSDIVMPNSDIIVLDPNNDQKALTLGDIEILEDIEFKHLLDAKALEERFSAEAAGVTFMSQAKIDELLSVKPIVDDPTVPILQDHDSGISKYGAPGSNQNDMSYNLSHRNDLTTITASSLYSRNQPQPLPYQQPILPESLPFFKNIQTLTDELSAILGEEIPPMNDHSAMSDYNSRLKLTDFEDDTESIFDFHKRQNYYFSDVNYGVNKNDISNTLNHHTELSAMAGSSLYGRNLQQQQQYPLPMLPEPIPYLKSSQSFTDELSAIFGEEAPPAIENPGFFRDMSV